MSFAQIFGKKKEGFVNKKEGFGAKGKCSEEGFGAKGLLRRTTFPDYHRYFQLK